jgi:hypothetical protein
MESNIKKRAQLYGIAAVLLAIVLAIAVNAYPTDSTEPIEEKPDLPPVALFNVSPTSLCYITWTERPGEVREYNYPTLTFASTSYARTGYIADHSWDFGDGVRSSGLRVVTHTYQNPGIYKVTLTATSDKGLNSTTYRTVKVVSAETTLSVYPSETNNEVGENFTVYISVLNVENLGAWQAGLQVDPQILECVSFEKTGSPSEKQPLFNETDLAYIINEGLFPETSAETIWIEPKIDNAMGTIGPAGCCLADPRAPGVSGNGSLAVITFRVLVKNDGSSLELIHALLLNAADGQEIPFNVSYG